MNKYEFNATNLIAETFEERGVKFDVVSHHGIEQLLAEPVLWTPAMCSTTRSAT